MDESARRLLRNEAIDHAATLVARVEANWGPLPHEGSFTVSPRVDDTAFPESLRSFHEGFYPYASGCATRDPDGRLLAVRSTARDAWESPSGAGQPDETPAETARREVREETGVVPRVTDVLYSLTMELDFGHDETLPVPVFVFTGEPIDGQVLDTDAVETPEEVAEIGWFAPADLPDSFRDRDLLQKHLS